MSGLATPVFHVAKCDRRVQLRSISMLMFLLMALSAGVFIMTVDYPVFDDSAMMRDIDRYARETLSVESLREHVNAPGPGSYLWMALFGKLTGRELEAYRFANFLAWIILAMALYMFSWHRKDGSVLWSAALFLLAMPHAVMSAGTALTEAPALLFAIVGSITWLIAVNDKSFGAWKLTRLFVGAILVGLSIISRQYYLALVPSMLFVLLQDWTKSPINTYQVLMVSASVAVSLLPLAGLYLIWGSLTSSGVASGASYPTSIAAVGFSSLRVIVPIIYCGIYAAPFLWLQSRFEITKTIVAFSIAISTLIVAAAAISADLNFLQNGPILSVVRGIAWSNSSKVVIELFLVIVSVLSLAAYLDRLYRLWDTLKQDPVLRFSLLVLLFFIIEQAGVGGTIPFYERYMFQIAPFLGYVIFRAAGQASSRSLGVLFLMSAFSHAMLWRNAW